MNKIELLAPAGNMDAFLAAVNNGADAVYIGGKNFGARSYASNFSNEEIEEIIKYAHIRDVRVYIVINTIIFDSEFKELKKFLDFLYTTDVDSLIVQDLGILSYINENYPSFTIHASTQMNIHTTSQALMLKDFGVKRIVLARETSVEEARMIKEEADIEVEVFGHGALCIAYSGNCLMSSFIGKRSGNRGRCAQPCRLPYKINNNENEEYFLSTKDLYTLDNIDKLIENNIDSIKLEGRMKRAEYVAQVTKSYRRAIDAYYLGRKINLEKEKRDLEEVFNREFTKGFLFGEENDQFTNTASPNHIGVQIGKVVSNQSDYINVKLTDSLSTLDSIRIVGKNTFGFTISKMTIDNTPITEAQSGQVVSIYTDNLAFKGDLVFLTKSHRHSIELNNSIGENAKKINITATLSLIDNYLVLTVFDGKNKVSVKHNQKVQKAQNENLTNDRLREQINKTQDTPYQFSRINLDLPFVVFLPIKEINDLRRRALDELDEIRSRWHIRLSPEAKREVKVNYQTQDEFLLKVKVRTKEQLDKVIEIGYKHIYLADYNLLKEYEKKYPELMFYHYMERIKPVSYFNTQHKVISDIGNIKNFKNQTSSIYLNIVNSYAVYFLIKNGVNLVGLSPEISKDQIKDLLSEFTKRYSLVPNLELNVYGYNESMIMRHDFLSKAKINEEQSFLIDRKNFKFGIIKENDVVKILNSQTLHLIDYLEEIKNIGIKSIYLDFTIESIEEVEKIAKMYLNSYSGKTTKTMINNASFGHFRDGVL